MFPSRLPAIIGASIVWASVPVLVQTISMDATVGQSFSDEPVVFIANIVAFLLVGAISAYVLFIFVKPNQRPALNILSTVAYLLMVPAALFLGILGERVMPFLGPLVMALLPMLATTCLGFLSGKVWVWATPERSQ